MSLINDIQKIEYKNISFLFAILPATVILGSAASNILILLIDSYFIFEIYKKNTFNF